MLFYKTDEEIEHIRTSCHFVCKTIAYVGSLIKPGVSGKFLDDAAETFILDQIFQVLPEPPYTPEDKQQVAALVYRHIWQQCLLDQVSAR